MKRKDTLRKLRKNIATYSLIAISVIYYIYMLIKYRTTTDSYVLIDAGAQFSPLIANGQPWRLLTSTFIHIGLEHLVINMAYLYFLGLELEELLGSVRFLIIYLLSGVGGSLLSFVFNTSVSAGASGGIFGLFACYAVLGRLYPDSPYLQFNARRFTTLIVINLILNLMSTNTDILGHAGGALFGGLITYVLQLPRNARSSNKSRVTVLLVTVLLAVCLYYLGIWRYRL